MDSASIPAPSGFALVVAIAIGCLPARASADAFWTTWGDGKAELGGYRLTQPRYGAARTGSAVLIFVTEDFSDSLRVKADPGKHPASDVFPVMKLNLVRRFQTGIYDYSVLSSTFVRIDATSGEEAFGLVKASLSVQEWCGHVYQQWLRRGVHLIGVSHSYFDGEADTSPVLVIPYGAVFEDAIPILVRGLRGAWLTPGEQREVPFLASGVSARFTHKPQAFSRARISRGKQPERFEPTGRKLDVDVYTVEEIGGATTRYFVEPAGAQRLLGWTRSDGEKATLIDTARLPYWELNHEGEEAALAKLGLRPR